MGSGVARACGLNLLSAGSVALVTGHGHHILEAVELATGWEFEAVAGSIHRFDESRFARIGLQLRSQMANVNADGLDVVVGFVSPNFFENERWRDGLTVALQQTMQEFEFEMR